MLSPELGGTGVGWGGGLGGRKETVSPSGTSSKAQKALAGHLQVNDNKRAHIRTHTDKNVFLHCIVSPNG